MNIPTPAAVKKLTEDRKAREAEQVSSPVIVREKKTPLYRTKAPSKESSTASSKRKSAIVSDQSASSPKAKGSPDRSSNSSTPKRSKGSRPSTSSTRRTTTDSVEYRRESNSTSRTVRKNSSTKTSADGKSISPETKKPFVRPDHLTTKPLRNNEALQKLRDSLEKPARGQFKREYRVNPRRSGKTQGLKNKKENS